jgi:hypothetical protein
MRYYRETESQGKEWNLVNELFGNILNNTEKFTTEKH